MAARLEAGFLRPSRCRSNSHTHRPGTGGSSSADRANHRRQCSARLWYSHPASSRQVSPISNRPLPCGPWYAANSSLSGFRHGACRPFLVCSVAGGLLHSPIVCRSERRINGHYARDRGKSSCMECCRLRRATQRADRTQPILDQPIAPAAISTLAIPDRGNRRLRQRGRDARTSRVPFGCSSDL